MVHDQLFVVCISCMYEYILSFLFVAVMSRDFLYLIVVLAHVLVRNHRHISQLRCSCIFCLQCLEMGRGSQTWSRFSQTSIVMLNLVYTLKCVVHAHFSYGACTWMDQVNCSPCTRDLILFWGTRVTQQQSPWDITQAYEVESDIACMAFQL